jgi:pimeloyl-ACP methyl ester carboxylesterase
MAQLDGGPLALFFAATRPERTSAVVLVNATARYLAADHYPIGIPREVAEALVAQVEQAWGTEALASMQVPSRAGDQRFRRWIAKLQRTMASPSAVEAYMRAIFQIDIRPLLPLIQAPTLILHRRDFQLLPIEHGRYLAEHIAGARLVELPGVDGPLMWETAPLQRGQDDRGVQRPAPL